MDPDNPDLLALRRRLEQEDKAYAEALDALDALAGFPLPQERLPELPELLARLNQTWETPPPPTSTGLAGRHHREHLITHLEVGDACADRAHLSRKIPPKDVGERAELVVAGPHLPVGAVDAGGDDVDHSSDRPSHGSPVVSRSSSRRLMDT